MSRKQTIVEHFAKMDDGDDGDFLPGVAVPAADPYPFIEAIQRSKNEAEQHAAVAQLELVVENNPAWLNANMPGIVEEVVQRRAWRVPQYLFCCPHWQTKTRDLAAVMHGILNDAATNDLLLTPLSPLLWFQGADEALRFGLRDGEKKTEAEKMVYPSRPKGADTHFATPLARICGQIQAGGRPAQSSSWFSLALSVVVHCRLTADELAALKPAFTHPRRGMSAHKLAELFAWLSADGTSDNKVALDEMGGREADTTEADILSALSEKRRTFSSRRKVLSPESQRNHDALLLFSMLDFPSIKRGADIRAIEVTWLLTTGCADPDTRTSEGNTALHLLAEQGWRAQQASQQDTDAAAVPSFGETFKNVFILLFQHGAFLSPRCPSTNPNRGPPLPAFETPLHLLMSHDPVLALAILQGVWKWMDGTYVDETLREQAEQQRLNFLRYLDFVSSQGETPLERLANTKADNKMLFKWLMERGANPVRREPRRIVPEDREALTDQCAKKRRPDHFQGRSELNDATHFSEAERQARQARTEMFRLVANPSAGRLAKARLEAASRGDFEMLAWFLQPEYWEAHPDGVGLILGMRRDAGQSPASWVRTSGSVEAGTDNNIYHCLFTPKQKPGESLQEVDARMQTFLNCLWQIARQYNKEGGFLAGLAQPNTAGETPESLLQRRKKEFPCTVRQLQALKAQAALATQGAPFAGDGLHLPA